MTNKKVLRVVEVGPRDGLQNEPSLATLNTSDLINMRVKLITDLAKSGLMDVEAGAFVRKDKIPQMAATDQVLRELQEKHTELWEKNRFWCLVPNRKGLELALAAKAKHIAVFTATSDEFNKKNIGMTVSESLTELKPLIQEALAAKVKVRAYISTVWGCPYSGATNAEKARSVSDSLLEMGAEEISLGDTIGVASPKQVSSLLNSFDLTQPLAVHFHDTRGTAIANSLRAIELGITTIDSSAGGLGGCPYAKGAAGNLATEDLLYMLHGMGFETNIEIEKVCQAVDNVASSSKLHLPSRFHSAWKAKQK